MIDITTEMDKPENIDVLLKSGEVFDAVTEMAKEQKLETLAILGLSKSDSGQISTPIVLDKSQEHGFLVLTQDSDHVVLTKTQAKNLAALLTENEGV